MKDLYVFAGQMFTDSSVDSSDFLLLLDDHLVPSIKLLYCMLLALFIMETLTDFFNF